MLFAGQNVNRGPSNRYPTTQKGWSVLVQKSNRHAELLVQKGNQQNGKMRRDDVDY